VKKLIAIALVLVFVTTSCALGDKPEGIPTDADGDHVPDTIPTNGHGNAPSAPPGHDDDLGRYNPSI